MPSNIRGNSFSTRHLPENSDKNATTEDNVYHGKINTARIIMEGLTPAVDELDQNNGMDHITHSPTVGVHSLRRHSRSR